jgi:nucleotide-binding universal stress UspA family protein
MIKKILLATDLSEKSDRAMERALKIAYEEKVKLYIVHIAPPYIGPKSKKWALDLRKDTEDLIKKYLYEYKDSAGIQTEIIIRQGGEVFFQILEVAYAHKVDLIIMGIHGKEKFSDLFVGTTIERIVRMGMKPVLMVKKKPIGPYQSIMSAVDFTPSSRAAMRLAMEIAPKAVFTAVHVYNVPVYYADAYVYVHTQEVAQEAQKKTMDAFLKTERSHFSKEHKGEEKRLSGKLMQGPLYDMLQKKAKNLKADLITIGAHGQFVLTSKLGGTASYILSNPPCDVLVAPEKFHE